MDRPVIISCAVTGGSTNFKNSPYVPITPEQIANQCVVAAKEGASICHIHVRDPKTGTRSMELSHYREVVERIRASGTDLLINLTTGPGARFAPLADDPTRVGPDNEIASPERRTQHILELRPDICSLDVATFNMGERTMLNTAGMARRIAELVTSAGVKPELEVFDLGHVRLAVDMVEKGLVASPPLFQFCLGISWGAPASVEAMLMMRNLLPAGAQWAAFGISRHHFTTVGAAVLLGGHVRVGLEDNIYIERGKLSEGNGPLVRRAAEIIRSLGDRPATPDEARQLIGLPPRLGAGHNVAAQ